MRTMISVSLTILHAAATTSHIMLGRMQTTCSKSSQTNTGQHYGKRFLLLRSSKRCGRTSGTTIDMNIKFIKTPFRMVLTRSVNTTPVLMTSLFMSLPSVSHTRSLLFILTRTIVLHPYYKLDYIKLAWGGAEEQAKERAAGNRNAKNWHDKALQVIENTMQEYWQAAEAETAAVQQPPTKPKSKDLAPAVDHSSPETLGSEFDRHRRKLIEQASRDTSTMGWSAKLRCYLTELPQNASKDMDVISWWSVSELLFEIHTWHSQ